MSHFDFNIIFQITDRWCIFICIHIDFSVFFLRVDFRNGQPVHWALAGELGSKSHFVLNDSDPSSAHLSVDKIATEDGGIYRCRIDYVDSPTKNYKVNLTVIGKFFYLRLYLLISDIIKLKSLYM